MTTLAKDLAACSERIDNWLARGGDPPDTEAIRALVERTLARFSTDRDEAAEAAKALRRLLGRDSSLHYLLGPMDSGLVLLRPVVGPMPVFINAFGNAAMEKWAAGALDEATELLTSALSDAQALGKHAYVTDMLFTRSELWGARGLHEKAVEDAEAAMSSIQKGESPSLMQRIMRVSALRGAGRKADVRRELPQIIVDYRGRLGGKSDRRVSELEDWLAQSLEE